MVIFHFFDYLLTKNPKKVLTIAFLRVIIATNLVLTVGFGYISRTLIYVNPNHINPAANYRLISVVYQL